MSEAHTFCKITKMYILWRINIGFLQKYGHKILGRIDMNLRCNSDFTTNIGQYFVDRRLCIDLLVPRLYFYIKHPDIIKSQKKI